ncbi:GGDEF domain-containing protein [Flavimaricola marinus]|nr:GGDEF domain-containing protein [Flavimaricola marinus]
MPNHVWRGMSRPDLRFVAVVVVASVVSSVLTTLLVVGPLVEAIVPAIVIPAVVSLPASIYMVRQRQKIQMLNMQLEDLLRRDPLTGVLTRRYFLNGVQSAMAGGGVLLVIDVDAFKSVNDTWGHPAGDRVLTEIAGRIGRAAGPDVRVGRLGGEEFAVFAAGVGLTDGQRLGEALRSEVAAMPISFDGTAITCTISIGLSMVPSDAEDVDPFMRLADRALYTAKQAGRDQVCLAEPLEARA